MPSVISRSTAKAAGLQYYFTGKVCKRGHVAERFVSNTSCIECHRVHHAVWYKRNSEKVRAKSAARHRANPEKRRAIDAARKRRNPDLFAAKAGRDAARRRAPDCVPSDFNVRDTIPFYREARHLARTTGIPHEVDHIIALILGGKHEASNLRVISRAENLRKAADEREELVRSRSSTQGGNVP